MGVLGEFACKPELVAGNELDKHDDGMCGGANDAQPPWASASVSSSSCMPSNALLPNWDELHELMGRPIADAELAAASAEDELACRCYHIR